MSQSVPLVDVMTEKEEVDRLEVRTAVTSANGLVNYLVKKLLQKAGLSSTYQANRLFKEVKRFIEEDFYVSPVSMEDIVFRKYFSIDYPPDKNDALTIMRNQFLEQVLETIPDQQRNIKFKEYRHSKKTIRPSNEPFELEPLQRSMFNKATFTHKLELEIAEFLDKKANDVEAWFKNTINGTAFFLDYTSKAKNIRRYYPDFIVRASDGTIYIVEAKGNDDLDSPLKHERLNTFVSMCNQTLGTPNKFKSLKIYETDWKQNRRNIYSMEDLYSFSLK